jgi:hypothetical protein
MIVNHLYKAQKVKMDDVCTICHKEMSSYLPAQQIQTVKDTFDNFQENIIKTPCNHVYHVNCLRKWFYTKRTCPIDN